MSHKSAKAARRGNTQTNDMPAWTPFEPGQLKPVQEADVIDQAKKQNVPVEEIWAVYRAIEEEEKIFINSRYQVNVRVCKPDDGSPSKLTHLSIKRRDKKPVHDWRDLQRIKNELIGPEFEAVEVYPAESRLVDTANQYHLWVFTEPGFRLPFGFNHRQVTETPGGAAVQRSFEK